MLPESNNSQGKPVYTLRQIWQRTCARIAKPFKVHSHTAPGSRKHEREITAVTRENQTLAAELQRLRADYEQSRAEENRKIAILEETRQEARTARAGEAKQQADLERRIVELETERTRALGQVKSIQASLDDVSGRLDTMDNQSRMWQARSDEQARELEASLSHAIARQDTAAGELSALRDRSQQQVMMLESSLADTSTRLETADSEIGKVKKKLDLEHRLYMHTVQEVQSQVRIQHQRLGWTMMAAVFAMLLGTVAGAILIRDVQKNARILADMSRDVDQLRSAFEQPSAMQPLATVEEPASLPGVTTKVDIPQTDLPREPEIIRPSSAISRKKPAASASRQPTNYYMLSSALARARQAPGNRSVVAPYFKEVMAKRGTNTDRQSVANEENTAAQPLITLPGGTQYRVVKNGNGKSPAPGDKVRVNYLAITPDGKVLAETYSGGEPATFDTNTMEPHLREALLKMEEGAEWEVYVPARLSPRGAIKARDRLASRQKVYLIELLQVIKGNISENGQPR